MAAPRKVALLGATGSIGSSTLDVLARHPDRYRLHSMAAASSDAAMASLLQRHRPVRVAMAESAAAERLRAAVSGVEIEAGAEAVAALAADPEVDVVVCAMVGAAGLRAALTAARHGKRVLLANKEALVAGGALVVEAARRSGAALVPVDSEHNAILQCLPPALAATTLPPYLTPPPGVAKLWLTASGGPFRDLPAAALAQVTVEQALAHPNWKMGAKITIDSATLMNKGLEVIEAHWLFGLPAERLGVVVHRQSLVHSLVEYIDGSLLAQLGAPDMRTPIACALAWPERIEAGVAAPAPTGFGTLDFAPPDTERFPCLRLAFEALNAGGVAPVVLNAANEVAVAAFLAGGLPFPAIAEAVNHALQRLPLSSASTLDEIDAVDRDARIRTHHYLESLK